MVARQQTWVISVDPDSSGLNSILVALFNGSGSGITISIMAVTASLVGGQDIFMDFSLRKIDAAPSGGTVVSPEAFDSTNTALPVEVTAQINPTSATAIGNPLGLSTSSSAFLGTGTTIGTINDVPEDLFRMIGDIEMSPIVLNAGEGISVVETGQFENGGVNITIVFTVT